MLTAFIVLQVILDIEIVLLLFWRRRRRRARAMASATAALPAEPPEWYRDFQRLAEDVLGAVEPVLDALDRGQLPMPAPAAAPAAAIEPPHAAPARAAPRERHREAFALLRAGTPSDEVARREHLSPGQVRLIENLVAAEGRAEAARP